MQELYDDVQPILDRLRFGILQVMSSLLFNLGNLRFVGFYQTRLLFCGFLFDLVSKGTKVGELFFELGHLSLETRLLQKLGLLIGVELLLGNEVVNGDARILSNDAIGFGSSGDLLVEVADVPGTALSVLLHIISRGSGTCSAPL